jgi:hypothetical protein
MVTGFTQEVERCPGEAKDPETGFLGPCQHPEPTKM